MPQATPDPRLVQRLRRLLAAGLSVRAAARRLGRGRSALHVLAAAHDLPRPGAPRRLRPAQRRALHRLLAAGWSQHAAARQVGCAPSTAWAAAHALEIRDRRRDERRGLFAPRPAAPYRCGCGALVRLKPCPLCHCRTLSAAARPGG